MNLSARARAYLAKLPGAVSGANGHDTTFTAACCVARFVASDSEAMDLLREYNQRCDPPWKEKDLEHKLADARKKVTPEPPERNGHRDRHHEPRPHRPSRPADPPSIPPVVCPPAAAMDLPEPIERGAVELLRALYRPEEHVRIAQATIGEDGRERPDGAGHVLPVREWLQRLEAKGGDPAGIWSSSSGAGVYVAMNPVKPGGTRDEDVVDYRFALVESDQIPPEEQWAAIQASRVPAAAVIDSAGKSVHAWVRVDAKDRVEYEQRVAFLHAYFPWADTKNKNPGRLSRFPDAKRRGRRQRLLALRHGCESWASWQVELQRQALGKAKSFAELYALDTSNDPNCVLGFRDGRTLRYLCRGKSAWLLGPSGIGKSSLEAQLAIGWAIGKPVFGISSGDRKLRSLIIQAENDDYDLAEMVQGVAAAHGIVPDSEHWADVNRNILFRTETSSFGSRFCERLRMMIEADRPDIVWVDPLLSFAGIDVAKQDQVTPFLRAELTPILEATGVVLIGVHHTGKPKDSKATRDWTAIDWAYAGLGSSELVNWARAVMLLRPSEGRLFELKLAKRGSRSGATHPNGDWAHGSVWIQQAHPPRIFWEHVDPPEEPVSASEERHKIKRGGVASKPEDSGEGDDSGKGPGQPSKVEQVLALVALAELIDTIPTDGVSRSAFAGSIESWASKRGIDIGRSSCFAVISRLIEGQKLTKNESQKLVKGSRE